MATRQTVTLISAFEAAPEEDEAFIARWEPARRLLAARDASSATALHRALRHDVALRFIAVMQLDSPEAWERAGSDPAFPGAEMPFRAHTGLYDVARAEGTVDIEGGTVLIDPFEVPDDQDERFLAGWQQAREALARQRGYLGTRLHRSLGPADFRFVEIARWSSPLMFARALGRPDVERAVGAIQFRSRPALYQVIRR
jgi:hypothetical protein